MHDSRNLTGDGMIEAPIRCFTCGKVIGDLFERYEEIAKEKGSKEALDELGITRYCCRRMFLTYVTNESLRRYKRW